MFADEKFSTDLLLILVREHSSGLPEHPGAAGAQLVADIVDGGDDQGVQRLQLGPALGRRHLALGQP